MSLLTPFSTPDLSLSEVASHVHTAMTAGTLTAGQAIAMLVRFAPWYNPNSIAAANDLRDVGPLPRRRRLHRARSRCWYFDVDRKRLGASTAARHLVAVAAVDPARRGAGGRLSPSRP